jgi:Uma2 family endonuclease
MAVSKEELLFTVDEYLKLERSSDERHEYLDGHIYLMAGESLEHGDICMNLSREVSAHLKGTPCRALSKDSKVRSGPDPKLKNRKKGLYSFPDLLVVCGEPVWHDEHQDVLLNPRVIIEVLSKTTAEFDRGEKFQRYPTWNPTLTDYVLVSQDRPLLEHFSRRETGDWLYTRVNQLSGCLRIESIGCTLSLSEVYDRVTFPDDQTEE